MNLSDIREGELKDVFDALEEAFHAKQIDFYLIGALQRKIKRASELIAICQAKLKNTETEVNNIISQMEQKPSNDAK